MNINGSFPDLVILAQNITIILSFDVLSPMAFPYCQQ